MSTDRAADPRLIALTESLVADCMDDLAFARDCATEDIVSARLAPQVLARIDAVDPLRQADASERYVALKVALGAAWGEVKRRDKP